MADVVAAIERPYRDVGSGLYILEYQLEDGGARLHFDANRKLDGWEFIPLRTTRNHSLGPVG
ncbi:hypothetical protein B5M42_004520 [Paenibacillus athensensis]|uniref:Uncharacterized protein n=1 Tax=Paenibacillus athensensis TaxID=1967502 RepID=A0A4Y8PSC4_9BACL|nr:hypothetical protein [Paenibacillus athensensis]MCD1258103.1 hypothetical protein [Paenibacillus athensensis]